MIVTYFDIKDLALKSAKVTKVVFGTIFAVLYNGDSPIKSVEIDKLVSIVDE